MPDAISFKSCGHGWRVRHGVVSSFGLCWRNVSDGLQKTPVVEPIDPFERGELHGLEVAPRSPALDDLDLVKTVDRFGEKTRRGSKGVLEHFQPKRSRFGVG